MGEKESDYENYDELPRVNKFVGESFGTDNVRTVYAGESRQFPEKESRVIILVGPMNAGKTSLIDFMCNLFYGATFNSDVRYKIANEKFDSSTPTKSIIKYVFNGTKMSYRPIVIDTPGIGHPSGIKTNIEMASHISEWLYFDPRSRIHAVGLVIPSYIHSITAQMEADMQRTLSMFPEWMRGNVVPLITYSEGNSDSTSIYLRHFNLHNNTKFRLNTSSLYAKPSHDPIQRHLQEKYWNLTAENLQLFFDYVSILHPQCMEERLPPWEMSKSPIPLSLPIKSGDLSDSGAESVGTPATIIERKKFWHENETPVYSPPPSVPPPPPPVPAITLTPTELIEFQVVPPLPPRMVSPLLPRISNVFSSEKSNEKTDFRVTTKTETKVIEPNTAPLIRQIETITTIHRAKGEEIEQTIRPKALPLGVGEQRSQSAMESTTNPRESDLISIKRYTFDPTTRSYKMQSVREQRVYHASSSQSGTKSRSRDVSPMPTIEPLSSPTKKSRESLYERITAELEEKNRLQRTIERKIDENDKAYKETHINGVLADQSPTKESTSTDSTQSPTYAGFSRAQYDTSIRSTASEWLYSPSRTSEVNGGLSDTTLPRPDIAVIQSPPTDTGVVQQQQQTTTTILHYDTPPVEYPPKAYENVYQTTEEIHSRSDTLKQKYDFESTTIRSEKHKNDEIKVPGSPTREPLFERNASARQSYHSNSFKRAKRAANNGPNRRPDTDYGDDWDSDIEGGRVPPSIIKQPIQHQPPPQDVPQVQTQQPVRTTPRQDQPPRQRREPSPPRVFKFPDTPYVTHSFHEFPATHSPRAPLISQPPATRKQPRTIYPIHSAKVTVKRRFYCVDDISKLINMCFLVCIPIFIVVVLIIIIAFLIVERN